MLPPRTSRVSTPEQRRRVRPPRVRAAAPISHEITGGQVEVWAALNRAKTDGRLVGIEHGDILPGGQVRVLAQLRAPRTRWERVAPWLLIAAKTLAVLAVLALVTALVWAIVWLVLAVIAFVAWVSAHLVSLIIGAVLILAVLILLFAGGSGGGGIHCPGCKG